MSLLDKVIGAVTPPESAQDRIEARARARQSAAAGSWLAQVLDHHEQIETLFASVKDAADGASRRAAQKRLAQALTGHSLAEEAVLYPALALHGEKADSTKAFTEQSAAKVQLAALEEMDPMSQDYLDKLEHLRGAVAHHVYEEESEYFPDLLSKSDEAMQARLSARYAEEYARYAGRPATSPAAG